MATSETAQKKNSDLPSKPMNFATFLKAVDTQQMNPANTPEVPLLLTDAVKKKQQDNIFDARLLQATGFIISAIWLTGAALYVQRTVGWNNVSQLMPHELGGFLAGILTPIALFWMIAAFVLRSMDVKLYADALREEIQAMIFPSDEANRRVNNDIERLMRQTAEMSKATKIMLSALDSARTGVRDQINELKGSSEETVSRMSALTTKLATQSQEVLSVKDQIDHTLTGLNARASDSESVISKLVQANADIIKQTDHIDHATVNAESAAVRLSTMLQDRINALTTIHEETEGALRHAGDEIAKQRQGLRVEAEAIEEKAFSIASTLDKSTEKLYNFTDDTLDKAKLIETRLLGQLSSIENVLSNTNNLSETIERATNNASDKLQSSTDHAVLSSQKIQDVLQEAIMRLEDRSLSVVKNVKDQMQSSTDLLVADVSRVGEQTQDIADRLLSGVSDRINKTTDKMLLDVAEVSDKTQTITDQMMNTINVKLADTTNSFANIQTQIQTLATLFDQRKGDLDKAGSNARQTAEALQGSLQAALNKVEDTTKALQTGISSINAAVQQPFALLENASVLADQRAQEMVALLESKAGTLTSAAAQIGGHVNSLHDQLHGKGQDVALLAGKIATHLKSVTDELNTQQISLDTKIQHSVKALQHVGVELDNQGTRVTDVSQNALLSLTAINQNLGHSVSSLQTLTDTQTALSEDLVKTESRLNMVSDRFVHISGKTVERIKATLEDMTLLEADYHRLSESGVENIQRLEGGFRQSLTHVQDVADKAMLNLQEQANINEQVLQQHATQISAVADSLKNVSNDIALSADQAILKVAKVQEAGNNVFGALQNITEKANQADQDLNLVTSHVTVHIDTIGEAMKRVEDITNTSVERFVAHGQSLQEKSAEVNISLQQTTENTNSYAHRIQSTLRQMRLDTENVDKALATSVTKMITQGEKIDSTTTRLVEKIARAHSDLVQHTAKVDASGDDLMARLKAATQSISDRATALEKAAISAQQQAEQLRAQESKLQRDTFFSSTKFVVESLHSLALDFTRLLEGELPEKTWKSYQKGDLGSFTRRLLNARDEETQAKIRQKFKDDLEFRTYAQRYLRQFEEIYDSAASNDHADLLTTVFLTSDVGKLYQFLCTVLEREKRGGDKG